MDAIVFRPPAKTLQEESKDRLKRICKEYNEASLLTVLSLREMGEGLVVAAIAFLIWGCLNLSELPWACLPPLPRLETFFLRVLVAAVWLLVAPPALVFWASVSVAKEKDARRFGGALASDPIERRARSLSDDPAQQRVTDDLERCRGHAPVIRATLDSWALTSKVHAIVKELEADEDEQQHFKCCARQDQVEAVCRRALFLYFTEEAAK
jgi:hypothetical protein